MSAPWAPRRRCAGSVLADNSLRHLDILSRYFYGFPASLLSGLGIAMYCAIRIRPLLKAEDFRPIWPVCLPGRFRNGWGRAA